MEPDYKMTMQEAKEETRQFKKIFTNVRLIDQMVLHRIEQEERMKFQDGHCNDFWNKNCPCENCVSLKAFEGKTQKTKLEFMDSDIYQVTARYVEIDGTPYVMEMFKCLDSTSLIDVAGQEKIVSKFARYNEKVYKDALTGAYNRRYFEKHIKKMTGSMGVAMIDLDDFKLYNDILGHNAGDAALETIGKIVQKSIDPDNILIRYGGDEFLLVVPNVKEDEFLKELQQIRDKIHDAKVPEYAQLQLSVSIGGVLSNDETIESAVCRADRLMYRAKNQKNMVVSENGKIGSDGVVREFMEEEQTKQQILIVDDSAMNRAILSEILKDDFEILEAENSEECLSLIEENGTGIALILLDIVMPGLDGFGVLEFMNKNRFIEDIPVIMISSESSNAQIRRAYELGVSDYISRPFDAMIVYQRVFNTMKLYAKQRRLTTLVTNQIYDKEKNNRMMISILSQIVEFRNGESGPHVLHINTLTGMILEKLEQKTDKYNLSWSEQQLITIASSLHDIGKIAIDEKILNKPGKLTKEEFEIMKTHTLIGASVLENLELYQNEQLVKIAYEICRWHHERYDGRGYPDGLKGDDIPISAQVVSLADVYDALTSKRVYKAAFSHEKAMEMILGGECGIFNPMLLECLVEIQDKIQEKLEKSVDKDSYLKKQAENFALFEISGADNFFKGGGKTKSFFDNVSVRPQKNKG